MTPQEQEHLDHVAGSATEHQNCHMESQIHNSAKEGLTSAKICQMNNLGLHVAIEVTTAYCRVTDGIIGTHTIILGGFVTKGAAESFLNMYADKYYDGESTFDIRSPLPMPPTKPVEDPLGPPETTREAQELDQCPF